MVPIPIDERLLAMVEGGRKDAFRASDVAVVEELVDVLMDAIERMNWARDWRAPVVVPVAKPSRKAPPRAAPSAKGPTRIAPDVKVPKKIPPKRGG